MDETIQKEVKEYFMHTDYGMIPSRVIRGLMRYKHYGVLPGSFLQSALQNKFTETVGRADPVMINRLRQLAMFLTNEMPAQSWGSEEKMMNWSKKLKNKQ